MSSDKEKELKEQIRELKDFLQDREAALPAHSIRPHQIQVIEDLEEKIAAKEEELRRLVEK